MKTVVLLNRKANSGKALQKWPALASRLAEVFRCTPLVCDETHDWKQSVADASRAGPCLVVAAGGDGTVHRAANLVLALPARQRAGTLLGAVGLGSSNDFHKPANGSARIRGVPVRCSPTRAIRQNVLRIDYVDGAGIRRGRYAVTSCSLGMAALGNRLFNRRWGPVGACRSLSVALGIWCASIASLYLQKDVEVTLSVDGSPAYEGKACLLGFYVNRQVAGGIAYPGCTDVVSPTMGVSLLSDFGVFGRVRLLAAAARGRLPGPPHTLCWQGRACDCVCGRPTLLEMDGEVTEARQMRVRMIPRGLAVCA